MTRKYLRKQVEQKQTDNGYRISVFRIESAGDWLYHNVNILDTHQWLRWSILCYVYVITINKNKTNKNHPKKQ